MPCKVVLHCGLLVESHRRILILVNLIWRCGQDIKFARGLFLIMFLHRFYERIAKTYRREQWGSLLQPLLSGWLACAQVLEDDELRVRLLVETLGHGWLVQLTATFDHTSLDALDIVKPEFANTLQEDLLATLKVILPSHAQSNCLIFSSRDTEIGPHILGFGNNSC